MTNPYFDHTPGAQYRGRFTICPECVTVVPEAYIDRHEKACQARGNAVEQVAELSKQEPAGLQVDDPTGWDEQDPTA